MGQSIDRVFSGAPWEKQVGYCRAIRNRGFIYVSGTAPIGDDGKVVAPGDGYLQAKQCFEIATAALEELDCQLTDVVRMRMFVTDISRWKEFGRAHHEYFADNPPATSMVEVKALIDPAMLIEVEVDAVISGKEMP